MLNQNEKSGKRKKSRILIWVLGIVLILLLGAGIVFKVYTSNYYRADNAVVNLLQNLLDDKVHAYVDKDCMVFLPYGQDYKAVIVFYPGGKVEYTAYSPLMYELAAKGYICLLPRMPENLAFLKIDAAEKIGKNHAKERKSVEDLEWYLAGHSLGGVAAATYMGNETEREYAGIILCASYTTTDFSNSDIRLLSIYGAEDKVLNMENYEESKELWPKDSVEKIIEGGIHSYFGSYGIQSGDGEAIITNEEQIRITANIIDQWIDK